MFSLISRPLGGLMLASMFTPAAMAAVRAMVAISLFGILLIIDLAGVPA